MTTEWYCLCISTPLNESSVLRVFKDNKIEVQWWFPHYQGSKQLKKKSRPVLRPVFSTYAFVKCEYTPEVGRLVEEVMGCYFVPGVGVSVTPIGEEEMQRFRDNIKEYTTSGTILGRQITNSVQVEIISGCLAGYTAVVKAVVKDTLVVEINMFGRTVPVTLKTSEISAI